MQWPGRIAKENGKQFKIPARIRFKLWFGAENDESNWLESHFGDSKSGILVTYAETVNFTLVDDTVYSVGDNDVIFVISTRINRLV